MDDTGRDEADKAKDLNRPANQEELASEAMSGRLNEELKQHAGISQPGVSEGSQEADKTNGVPREALDLGQKQPGRFKRFLRTRKGKVVVVLVAILAIAGILLAIPLTRYTILGMFIKKDVPILVMDSTTKKPVTEAQVTLGSLTGKTDGEGKLTLQDVPLGEYKLKVAKSYYTDSESPFTLPIFGQTSETKVDLEATGRQVPVTLVSSITNKPLEKALITVGDASATSDAEGKATIVLPADADMLKGTVKLDGYNQAEVDIKVTDQADVNTFSLTPAGNVYYLSKQTGKLNVMKAHLDGTNPRVVLEGTGNESDAETVLLAARDWQYAALSAKRKAGVAGQLYLINTKDDSAKTIDEGNVSIQLVGWSDHNFLYIVTRNEKKTWEDGRQALKSYNAENGQLSVIDETKGSGTQYGDSLAEYLVSPYIVEGKLLYAKNFERGPWVPNAMPERKSAIVAATPANGQRQVLQEFSSTRASIAAKLYEPQEVYFRVSIDSGAPSFYEYEGGALKSVTNTDDKFYNTFYPTFLVSPSGQKTFWHEPRDGKNAIFVGDKNGKNSTELARQSEYTAYGWFSDRYILLTKNGSELYIASATDPLPEKPLKIVNYHKPALSFPGYGYGYGGQ